MPQDNSRPSILSKDGEWVPSPSAPGGPIATPSAALTKADKKLITREADRLVDIVMGRANANTVTSHYLIAERPARFNDGPCGPADIREIEQYRDPERVIAQAADFETGDRRGKWIGGFAATYVDGKLASVAMVKNMDRRVKAELAKRPGNRLNPLHRPTNMMRPPADTMAQKLEEAAATGLRNFGEGGL